MEITHDESYSLFLVDTNYLRAMVSTANTHWLNSFFMKLFSITIGIKPWMVRLHSVIAFPILAYFLFQFYLKLTKTSSRLILISLFFINLFVLEFFTLARGYGMSLAFITASLYYSYLIIESEEFDYNNFKKLLIFGILALASNYTVFFQFIGIFTFPMIYLAFKNGKIDFFKTRKQFNLWLFFLLAIFTAIANLLMIKFISHDLQFGGYISFFGDTLESIIRYVFFTQFFDSNFHYFSLGSVLLFSFLLLILGIAIYNKNQKIIFFTSLFFFQFIISNLLFLLFNTPYPFNRTALMLVPSIAFSIVWSFESLNIKANFHRIIGIIFLSVFCVIFINSYTLKSSYEWPFHAEVGIALDEINSIAIQSKIEKPKVLFSNYPYGVWANYYNHFYSEKYNFDTEQILKDSISKLDTNTFYPDFIISNITIDSNANPQLHHIKLIKTYKFGGLRLYEVGP